MEITNDTKITRGRIIIIIQSCDSRVGCVLGFPATTMNTKTTTATIVATLSAARTHRCVETDHGYRVCALTKWNIITKDETARSSCLRKFRSRWEHGREKEAIRIL